MADYYGNNDWRDYLAHYGVKGMKWRKHKYTSNVNGEYQYSSVFNRLGEAADSLRKQGKSSVKSTRRALRRANVEGRLQRLGYNVTKGAQSKASSVKKAVSRKLDNKGNNYLSAAKRARDGGDVDSYYRFIRGYNQTIGGKRHKKRTGSEVREVKDGVNTKRINALRNVKVGVGDKVTGAKQRITSAKIAGGIQGRSSSKPLKRKKKVASGGTGVNRREKRK